MAEAEYPINYHILAEDFKLHDMGRDGISTDQAEWLLRSLRTMCEEYDKQAEKIEELRKDLELSVCYSPSAIVDSYDSYDDNDPLRVAVENASDEDLLDISYMIVGSDPTWSDFHNNIDMCVREKFKIND